MTDKKNKSDYTFAQEICAALRKGKTEAIEDVYELFHRFFLAYTKKRLRTLNVYDEHDALSVVDKYWIELTNSKYICKYEGKGSLENYLMLRLKARIIDKIRKVIRAKEELFSQVLVNPGDDRSEDDQIDAAIYKNDPQGQTPDHQLESKQIEQIIYESLFELETESPHDAYYIKMYLDSKTYKQMAQDELGCENLDEAMLKRKTNSIKVQFTRKKTGSLARYEKILVRNMDKYGIDVRDLPLSFDLELSEKQRASFKPA